MELAEEKEGSADETVEASGENESEGSGAEHPADVQDALDGMMAAHIEMCKDV